MGAAARALGFAVFLLLSLIPARAAVSDTLEELQRRFDNETDGVNKAKMLRRLGDAQFDREREAAKAAITKRPVSSWKNTATTFAPRLTL